MNTLNKAIFSRLPSQICRVARAAGSALANFSHIAPVFAATANFISLGTPVAKQSLQ
jgi:hypothetical protein